MTGTPGVPVDATPCNLPRVQADAIPWLSVAQMREIDRLMVGDYRIELRQMMENAGRSLAILARHHLGGSASGADIIVLCGPGGNGGGGMVAARHLANAGARVRVCLATERHELAPIPEAQLSTLERMGLPATKEPPARAPDLILDCILGYGQRREPKGRAGDLVRWASGKRTLALDVPSGLELETGILHEVHVAAEATLTIALPKRALRDHPEAVGVLYLADISVPQNLYAAMSVTYASPFGHGPIVRIDPIAA